MMRKNIIFFIIAFSPIANSFTQKLYEYEMSMSGYNVGYYYVEYSNQTSPQNDSLVVQFLFYENVPCRNIHVDFVIGSDTVFAICDTNGCVNLPRDMIKPNKFFKFVIHPMLIFDKVEYMEKIIRFWEWGKNNQIEKINVYVTRRYNSVVYIKSKKPLSPKKIIRIKEDALKKKVPRKNKNIEVYIKTYY